MRQKEHRYAGGNGVIEYAGNNGGYGKYIRIRHNNEYKTAYAHLSKFKKGISKGVRVNQGDVIGYVGSTGNSTGPHLHYEILFNNKQINPLKLKLPSGKILEGNELKKFQKNIKKYMLNISIYYMNKYYLGDLGLFSFDGSEINDIDSIVSSSSLLDVISSSPSLLLLDSFSLIST